VAVSDIPPFVPATPDDLIRSEDINTVQRLARNTIRGHRHTFVAGTPRNDASTQDVAPQLATDEMIDLLVTSAKLAANAVASAKIADGAVASAARLTDNAVATTKLQDGAVTAAKLAPTSVARANIQGGAVGRSRLAMVEVASGTQFLAGFGTPGVPTQVILMLRPNLPDTLKTVFLPSVTLVSTTTGTAATFAQVEAAIVYRRGPVSSGPVVVDLMLRLSNTGQIGTTVNWRVMTFAPFNPAYPFGFRAGIGGELV
jgi:hypothetical protein